MIFASATADGACKLGNYIFLPFKSTSNVQHFQSAILRFPILEIKDYVFAKELLELQKNGRNYLSSGNTLARMLVKDDANSKKRG